MARCFSTRTSRSPMSKSFIIRAILHSSRRFRFDVLLAALSLTLKLVQWNVLIVSANNGFGDLPNLYQIVIGSAAHNPRVV